MAVSYACSFLSLESVERKGSGCQDNHSGSLILSNRIVEESWFSLVCLGPCRLTGGALLFLDDSYVSCPNKSYQNGTFDANAALEIAFTGLHN